MFCLSALLVDFLPLIHPLYIALYFYYFLESHVAANPVKANAMSCCLPACNVATFTVRLPLSDTNACIHKKFGVYIYVFALAT